MERWKKGRQDEVEIEEKSGRREDVTIIQRVGGTCRGTVHFVPRVYDRRHQYKHCMVLLFTLKMERMERR